MNFADGSKFGWGKYHINFYDASSLAKLPMVIDEFIPCRMPDKKPVPMFARRQLKGFCHQLWSMESSIQITSPIISIILVSTFGFFLICDVMSFLLGEKMNPHYMLAECLFFWWRKSWKSSKVWTGCLFHHCHIKPQPFWINNHAGSKVTWYTWFYHAMFCDIVTWWTYICLVIYLDFFCACCRYNILKIQFGKVDVCLVEQKLVKWSVVLKE